ncbi:MAG: peptidoglycan bridge formation glycyltransferase FemA/FemB family protein [Chloroflexi bacterium]|nr:peptidoglycan bridge formation glycyltransferase FemA/FemB family protein [Chloroflexota bacterium]
MITSAVFSGAVQLVERAAEWDEFIASAPDGHLLQSYRWGEFKARYGWLPECLLVRAEGGTAAAQVLWRRTPLGAVAYLPRGPVAQPAGHEGATRALLAAVHRRARARGALFLKVEPNSNDPAPLPLLGFRPSAQTVQPCATLMVDLAADLETISSRQHSKTRYNIRLAAKKGVRVRRGDHQDVPTFYRLMEETSRRDGFAVHTQAYYRDVLEVLGDQAELLLAEHEGEVLAGIIVGTFQREAIYLYGASTAHKRNLMPTYLVQWEAMRRAHEAGCVRYDLWGVPADLAAVAEAGSEGDEALPALREHQRGDLWGVYRFKRGFGGKLVGYCGAYDYVYHPSRYWLWQHAVPRVLAWLRRGQGIE